MSVWIIIQLAVNFTLFSGIVFLLIQRKQGQKEDHRFSKGLQLLQNKIAILEDLSDQTDSQVKTLTQLLESKYKEMQTLLIETDQQIQRMEEVAENTWKQIQSAGAVPHNPDTQNLNKYVKAAQMAHSGSSLDDIMKNVDLNRGEVELISAMNKDRLVFNQNSLPAWIDPESAQAPQKGSVNSDFIHALKKQQHSEKQHHADKKQDFRPQQNEVMTKSIIPETATIQQNGKTLFVRPMSFKKIEN